MKDAHTEHCCSTHGCKYGDPGCPVLNQKKEQSYPCEWCDDAKKERDKALAPIIKDLNKLITHCKIREPGYGDYFSGKDAAYDSVRDDLEELVKKYTD